MFSLRNLTFSVLLAALFTSQPARAEQESAQADFTPGTDMIATDDILALNVIARMRSTI
jgi:hypothetical protein